MTAVALGPMTESQRDMVRALKGARSCGGTAASIEIRHESGACIGTLTPLTPREAGDGELCAALSRWRRMYRKNFLTQFESTPQRTAQWLTSRVLADDTRVLFLIRDQDGRPVGNFGLCNISAECAELDNLIRGERGGDARLIYFAELALLAWAYTTLDVQTACLHVMSTNGRTIALHVSVGFTERARSALWQHASQGDTCLTTEARPDAEPAGMDLVRMELDRDVFAARHAWTLTAAKGALWTR